MIDFSILKYKHLQNDFILMIVLGFLSIMFGMISFNIPGVDDVISDFREIPLLISIIHFSNPLFVVGISAITLISSPSETIISTFIFHTVALFISWFFYNKLKKNDYHIAITSLLNIGYIFLYYMLLVFPLLILTYYLIGINLEKRFFEFYKEMIISTRFEIISTTLIVTLYYVQFVLRKDLLKHKEKLEETVLERTNHLNSTIEELKVTQQYLIQSEKMASIGTLTSGVAHEINNPLNFISGGLDIMNNIMPEIEKIQQKNTIKQYKNATHFINTGTERISKIVNALMDFSPKGHIELKEYNIHDIIDNTLLFLKTNIPKDIEIKKNYNLKTKTHIFVDNLHQVLLNVLNNALFELNSVKSDNKTIIISTKQDTKNIYIQIFNNNSNIPEENIRKIFDPFYTTKAPNKGTGIGLSISYNLMHEMGGEIIAKNEDGGVCFSLVIPLKTSNT